MSSFGALSMRDGRPPALEQKIDTIFATGTWTCPAGVTSVLVECWGAGGGGSTNVRGGGGGGYSASLLSVTPGVGYSVTVGTGAAGADGGDSSFGTGPLVLAKGGLSGANGGTGGQASSGVGTTKFSGGTGSNNLAANNGGGGGCAGDLADGANAPGPGGPGGASSGGAGNENGNQAGEDPGGGGACSTSAQGAGGRGSVRIVYFARVADTSFPWIVRHGRGRQTTDTTSHAITMPGSVRVNDYVILALHFSSSSLVTITAPAGWTLLADSGGGSGGSRSAVYYRMGPDNSPFTTDVSSLSAHTMVVVRGAGSSPVAGTFGSTTNFDATTVNPGSNLKRLWFAFAGENQGQPAGQSYTALPAGYGDFLYQAAGDGINNRGRSAVMMSRKLQAASEDPGLVPSTGTASHRCVAVAIAA